MVAIRTFSTDSIVKRHPTAVFFLEFILSTVIPAVIVSAVCSTLSYKPEVLLMSLCIPTSNDIIFYSYTLPFQICCFCVTAMCISIIRRIKQVSGACTKLVLTCMWLYSTCFEIPFCLTVEKIYCSVTQSWGSCFLLEGKEKTR